MTIEATRNATDLAPRGNMLDGIFDKLETMLRPASAGTFSANEAPLTAVIRAAGRPFGVKPGAGSAPGADEPMADAVQRIARSAGLIAREIALGSDWQANVALPVVAVRTLDQAPIALLPRGGSWRYVDGSAPRSPVQLLAEVADGLEDRAWVLGPAFADTPLTSNALLAYGLSNKLPDLAAYAVMSIIAGLALACIPIANMAVTEIVLPGRDVTLLQHVVAMILALILASIATRFSASLCQLRLDGRTGSILRAAAVDRMIRLARAPDAKPQSPATAALITRSVEGWHRGVWKLGLTVLSGVLIATPSLVVMTRTAPLAALLVLAVMMLAVLASSMIAKRQIAHLFNGPCSPTSWIGMSFEALAHIGTVRALAAERQFFKHFSESFLGLKDRFLVTDRMGATISALERALEPLIIAVAIITVVAFRPDLDAGSSVAFTMAVMTVAGTAVTIVNGFSQASMLGMQHRMIEPFMKGTPPPASSGSPPGKLKGRIVMHDIVVKPTSYAPPVLDGVSLSIEPGQQIGVVGPSGSGKSTLIKVLVGLSRIERGRVLIDGTDLAQLDAAAVRRQIGQVSQSGRLFPGTILDNIAAGVTLSQEDAWSALKIAALDDDVRDLPLGLSTPIGDANPVLSTGQVQRLLIARAVASRPRIIILDEATSALDPATEARVTEAISALEATVVSVAHRLDTIRHCHRIYVMDKGRVVEAGTYAELSRGQGVFSALVKAEGRTAGSVVDAEQATGDEPVPFASAQAPLARSVGNATPQEPREALHLLRMATVVRQAATRPKPGMRQVTVLASEHDAPSGNGLPDTPKATIDDAVARITRLKQVYAIARQ